MDGRGTEPHVSQRQIWVSPHHDRVGQESNERQMNVLSRAEGAKVSVSPQHRPDSDAAQEGAADAVEQADRIQALVKAMGDMISSLATVNLQVGREVTAALDKQPTPRTVEDGELDRLRRENAQLRDALEGRGVIERAKGMLMVSRRCDEDVAFQILVAVSRRQRRRVREVAAEVVLSGGALTESAPRPGGPVPGTVARLNPGAGGRDRTAGSHPAGA
jgi:hypothetical protein